MLMMLTYVAPAAAQSFDWGIVGGMNFTKLKFKSGNADITYNSDQKCGWYIGPNYK